MKQESKIQNKGLTATQLKIIAVVAMIIDHLGVMLVENTSSIGIVMRFIGRITAPVMFYFIAEGYHYTRNVNKYTLRLGLFAVISWIPFIYFKTGALPNAYTWHTFSVMYTLLLGLFAIRAWYEISNNIVKIIVIGALIILSIYGDWDYYGVILPLFFAIFHKNFKLQATMASVVITYSVLEMFVILWQMNVPMSIQGYGLVIIELGQFVPIGLLCFYNGQRGGGQGKLSKWFFYIIYPVHLIVLGVIRYAILA